jgi:hypothetical protein
MHVVIVPGRQLHIDLFIIIQFAIKVCTNEIEALDFSIIASNDC